MEWLYGGMMLVGLIVADQAMRPDDIPQMMYSGFAKLEPSDICDHVCVGPNKNAKACQVCQVGQSILKPSLPYLARATAVINRPLTTHGAARVGVAIATGGISEGIRAIASLW